LNSLGSTSYSGCAWGKMNWVVRYLRESLRGWVN
jgi:hypothetical protein